MPSKAEDLYAIYKSEVMGEALFLGAARWSRQPTRKHQWQRLADLETQTMARYLEFVGDDVSATRFPRSSWVLGKTLGPVFALLPWRAAMKALADGTDDFLEVFRRLLDDASDSEREFFEYVVAHELAIKAFAEAELAGEADALGPVEALLE